MFDFHPMDGLPGAERFLSRRNVVSMDILAPALDHATIGYERKISDGTALRVKLGYIGLWRSEVPSERILRRGWLLRAGPKFKLPESMKKYPALRSRHPLAGWYMSPELLFSYYADPHMQQFHSITPFGPWSSSIAYTYRASAAINLTLGHQLMLGQHITCDIHGGLGYGVRWANGVAVIMNTYSASGEENYKYSHAFLGLNTPLCASAGVSFGYLF
ncbi:MAG: hypothetical protein KF905_10795 [Flavobacteriales bacterium]|nr:hypothetical protein [Flavobacteriales bacterium]